MSSFSSPSRDEFREHLHRQEFIERMERKWIMKVEAKSRGQHHVKTIPAPSVARFLLES